MIKTFNRVITWALAVAIMALLVFARFKHFCKPTPNVREMTAYKKMLEEAEPSITAQEAEALTKELMPLVEGATDRIFKQIHKIRLIGRAESDNILRDALLSLFRNRMPDANS